MLDTEGYQATKGTGYSSEPEPVCHAKTHFMFGIEIRCDIRRKISNYYYCPIKLRFNRMIPTEIERYARPETSFKHAQADTRDH